jgi:beta-galactosidase
VRAEYTSGELGGRAAVFEHDFGSGRVVYIGTRLEPAALRDVLLGAVAGAGIAPTVRGAPAFVEATRRSGPQAEFLFLLNHSATRSATVELAGDGVELLSGAAVRGSVTLDPLAVAVIRI